jgi:hypothetical protein
MDKTAASALVGRDYAGRIDAPGDKPKPAAAAPARQVRHLAA